MAVHLHQAGLDEPVDAGFQAAQPGRKRSREHVERAFGKIHRRPACVRRLVECAALLDVVRYIGNVHPEPVVSVGQHLERDGIIEVSRRFAIDGHGQHRSKVGSSL